MYTKFWSINLKERDHSKYKCRWEDNFKMDIRIIGGGCGLDASDSE
jgi:hypothetical protein